MTTLHFSTIWDRPLAGRRDVNEVESDTAPLNERFLTIWDSPHRPKAVKRKRSPRKLSKFYL